MGLLDIFKRESFNDLLEKYKNDKEAYLIDVREKDEFKSGHVPNSKNIPMSEITNIENIIKDKNRALYVYCLSGSRSKEACRYLKRNGYLNVYDLGGIHRYRGNLQY